VIVAATGRGDRRGDRRDDLPVYTLQAIVANTIVIGRSIKPAFVAATIA